MYGGAIVRARVVDASQMIHDADVAILAPRAATERMHGDLLRSHRRRGLERMSPPAVLAGGGLDRRDGRVGPCRFTEPRPREDDVVELFIVGEAPRGVVVRLEQDELDGS